MRGSWEAINQQQQPATNSQMIQITPKSAKTNEAKSKQNREMEIANASYQPPPQSCILTCQIQVGNCKLSSISTLPRACLLMTQQLSKHPSACQSKLNPACFIHASCESCYGSTPFLLCRSQNVLAAVQ